MRTATCLTLLAVGAILTFAVTGHPRFLNVQVAGLVVMATGAAGLLMPRTGGWLHRRIIVRPDPGGRVIGRRTSRYARYQLTPGNSSPANGRSTGIAQDSPTVPQQAAGDAAPDAAAPGTGSGRAQAEASTQVVDEYLES
jgi:hypothetical protein